MIFIRHKHARFNLSDVKMYEDTGNEVKFFIKRETVGPVNQPLVIPKSDTIEVLIFESIAEDIEHLFHMERRRVGSAKEPQTTEDSKKELNETGKSPPTENTGLENPFAGKDGETDPKSEPPAPSIPQRSGVSRPPESLKTEREKSKTDIPF